MKRRKFIKTIGAAAAGSLVVPYILPSGSLFAQSGSGLADHVVFVLFAGGVRQQESVLQRYLADSQGLVGSGYEGNIMSNILNGSAPSNKIVYGTDPAVGLPGSQPIPKLLSNTIQEQGTLFKEVKAAGVGHYTGLCTLITGSRTINQGLRQRPYAPTIFEYARKFLDLKATETWFIGNGIGNSVPLLNHSNATDFGLKYGANFFAPNVTFGEKGENYIANAKPYHPEEELGRVYEMQEFLNQSFSKDASEFGGIQNTEAEKHQIKDFVKQTFQYKASGVVAHPPVHDNNDLTTIGYACEVMKYFKPKVTVINLSNVDGCHSNFTGYLGALHRADHGVAHLWNFIQTQIPEMAGNTFMMIMPEHGRNENPNSILDQNNWLAYDHSDINSTRIFGAMVGPGVDSNLVIGNESNPIGDISDGILTLGEVLGIKAQIQAAGYVPSDARSLFDRI